MVGSMLKQLTDRCGLRVSSGVAYGSVLGYAVTLSESDETVDLAVSTMFPEPGAQSRLEAELQQLDLAGAFYVQSTAFGERFILFRFRNTAGTLHKLEAFLNWFFPRLGSYRATDASVCSACGQALEGDAQWKLIDGTAHRFHDGCARQLRQSFRAAHPQPADKTQSLLWGILGAVLGAIAGGFLWGAVLVGGYLIPALGFFIGWLAQLGYDLLHGKPGTGKTVALILITLCMSFLAYLAAFGVYAIVRNPQGAVAYGNVPKQVLSYVFRSWKQFGGCLMELLPSLAFAIVGIFVRTPKKGKTPTDDKMIDLP